MYLSSLSEKMKQEKKKDLHRRFLLQTFQVRIDALADFFGIGNGFHHRFTAIDHISGAKDAFHGCMAKFIRF
jgi:hypothetical protein